MENNTNQALNYCKRNCGFFGNQAFDGYCSKCYKEHVKRQNSGSAAGRVTPTSISINSEPPTPIATSSFASCTPTPAPTPIASSASLIVNTPNVPNNSNNNSTSTSNSNSPVTFNLISNDIEIENTINDNNLINNNNNLTSNQNLNAKPISNVESTNSIASSLPENASSCSLSSSEGEKKTKRNRCNIDTCRRKLGLTGYDCRCGGIYCWEHRYSDKHCCQFDYKELGQEQIRKNNPVVVGEKIQKI